jgi:carbon-monoxide dehydrogenase medium subunit
VKPAPFVYSAPDDVEGAVALLAEHGDDAKVLAGGQSLVPMMAMRLASPAQLVDIGRIDALGTISTGSDLCIRAGVTQRRLERAPGLRERCAVLADALPCIAHPPIRNRGTVCGSLAHADPAAELPAVMLAVDATFVLLSTKGERRVAADDFFVSFFGTALAPEELLVEVRIPPMPSGAGSSFVELSRRSGDFALAGIAACVVVENDVVTDARLTACGLGSTPIRLREAESALRGCDVAGLDGSRFDEIGAIAAAGVDPPSDVHAPSSYRRKLARVLVRDAIFSAVSRAGAQR